ncbi:MAG TPA: hypothetical protein VFA25_00325 [Actinomycetota bacterium]|nr:hypothetical protein [Actinomycetota bacterium]
MVRFLRLNDEDVERILRGLPPEGGEDLRDLADFLADAAALSRSPAREVRAAHLSLLAGAIRTSSAGPEVSSGPAAAALSSRSVERRHGMRSPVARWAAKVTLAAATLVASTAALAWAGVDLPGTAAETAFQKVLGVELPNQGQDAPDPAQLPDDASDTAVGVLTAIHDWRSGAGGSGCEFGATVSAAARGLEGEPDTSHCAHVGGNGAAGEHGAGNGAENASHAGAGLDTAGEASGGAATEGQAHAADGLGTAEGASGGDHAVDGPTTADQASGGRIGGPATAGSR